ncbi:hypothetical protein Taro_054730 [Colocasia esculenta]|uniref:homoserine dehydrogenase n=1 Tax=Colocasia esculenta TaxID=4460 RepID=A0A843XQW7_COLES|nr:hypothetical protein [Colocasia esculenta]
MKKIPIVVMGCGGVGRQLLEHIVSCRVLHSKQASPSLLALPHLRPLPSGFLFFFGLALRVVGVCDSQSMLVANDIFTTELDDDLLARICREKSSGSALSAIADIGKFLTSEGSLSCTVAMKFVAYAKGTRDCQVFNNRETIMQVVDIAGLLGRSTGLAVVDCSASSETVEVLKQVVDSGCSIVLANKKPLTSAIEDYEKLTSHARRIRYESTVCSCCFRSFSISILLYVSQYQADNAWNFCPQHNLISLNSQVGAGLPVIASVTRVIASGDPIFRIVGSLSGTLGYVMSEVEEGKPFSEVVRSAKRLGYTEPGCRHREAQSSVCYHAELVSIWLSVDYDPTFLENRKHCKTILSVLRYRPPDAREDLSGMDVARKALILARLLGWQINMDDIKVESLYAVEMGPDSMSTEDFLNDGLLSIDKEFSERVKAASAKGNVLRYVCLIEGSSCQVGLQELPKLSSIGRLRGSDNVVEIYSRCYKESPLVIQGAGAGNDTTAAGVLADIVDLQDLFK